jgi:hypothetical protein
MNNIMKRTALVLVALCATGAEARESAEQALWKTQEIQFTYRGYSTTYDCQALRAKVSQLLAAAGARHDTSVQSDACEVVHAVGGAPAQLVLMRLKVTSPAIATSQAEAEVAGAESRRELLKRLGKTSVPTTQFPALWVEGDLARAANAKLRASDCELLEQFADQVLPKMAIKEQRMSSCSSSSHRLKKPSLRIITLLPAPEVDAAESVARK